MRVLKRRLVLQAHAVPAGIIDVEIKWDMVFLQSVRKHQRVFHRYHAVPYMVQMKHGGVFVVTCSSLDSEATSSADGLVPRRLSREPWWVYLPMEMTG